MPAEAEGRATDTEVWNLVIYIRSLSQPPAPASSREIGDGAKEPEGTAAYGKQSTTLL